MIKILCVLSVLLFASYSNAQEYNMIPYPFLDMTPIVVELKPIDEPKPKIVINKPQNKKVATPTTRNRLRRIFLK